MPHGLTELTVSSGDLLRYLDARFEPHDPIFDAEDPPPRRTRRRKLRPALAAALLTAGCGFAPGPALHATDSILVQLEPGAAPPARAAAESGPPIVALEQISAPDEARVLRIPIAAGDDPVAAAEEAARQPGVAFAEPVYLYRADRAPNDPRYRDQWGLARIDAPAAWGRTTGDRNVVVAVVDDGVALDHPDLKPNLWVNPDEVPGNGEDDDGDGIIDDLHGADFVDHDGDPSPAASGARWHGSHVAGIIGAAGDNRAGVSGVNWQVSLMSLRALGPQGGRSDDLARAIDYAVDHGARVINASWSGGGASRVLEGAIARAGRHGVLFVGAAGNEGAARPAFPANLALPNLLSVGAAAPGDLLAPFSNRGADVAAPGVGILSTTAPGQYERYDGTSMAAPHVAGLAALLWAAHPEATLAQVRGAVLSSGEPLEGAEHGRIDALRALTALDGLAGSDGALLLSRRELSFSARPGLLPLAQGVSLRLDGGAAGSWSAAASAPWLVLPTRDGRTPARVVVRVDPSGLTEGDHEGAVVFRDGAGRSRKLAVHLRLRASPGLAAVGPGCAMRDGVLHARVGSGCALDASGAGGTGLQWSLPGGGRAAGATVLAHFVRPGRFELAFRRDSGAVEPVPVVVE